LKLRTSERNLGIEYWQIPVALRELLDDAKTWVACEPIRWMRSASVTITGWSRFTRSPMATDATPG
jgi:hypothetical protein